MKNTFLILAVGVLFAGSSIISCDARVDDDPDRQDLAPRDTVAQQQTAPQQFGAQTEGLEQRIERNEERIEELRSEMDQLDDETKEQYEARIDALEERNQQLRDYAQDHDMQTTEDDGWEEFEQDFQEQVDSLGREIENLYEDMINGNNR